MYEVTRGKNLPISDREKRVSMSQTRANPETRGRIVGLVWVDTVLNVLSVYPRRSRPVYSHFSIRSGILPPLT